MGKTGLPTTDEVAGDSVWGSRADSFSPVGPGCQPMTGGAMYHNAYLLVDIRYVIPRQVGTYCAIMDGRRGDGRGAVLCVAQPGQCCWAPVRLEPVKGGVDGT